MGYYGLPKGQRWVFTGWPKHGVFSILRVLRDKKRGFYGIITRITGSSHRPYVCPSFSEKKLFQAK